MRIAFFSDSYLLSSAYGRDVRSLATGLQARGHSVLTVALQHIGPPIEPVPGIPIFGARSAGGLADVLKANDADVLCHVRDAWSFYPARRFQADAYDLNPIRRYTKTKIVSMTPLDSAPAPREFVETVSGCADLTIVQAEWEKEQLAAQGAPIDKMRVLAHGVDTGIFHPGPGDRARAKLPDGRMLLSVGSNTDRKNVPGSMLLLKKYLDAGGDPSTFLYLHTSTQGWYFLDCFVNALGFAGKKKVFVLGSDEGNPVTLFGQDEEDLANIYRTADAFLQPTFAEGFGVTILEALASGLPAVMTDTPILRELYSEFPGALFMPSRQEIASTWGFRWFPDTDVGATQVRDALEHGKYAHVDVPRKFLWSQIVSDLEGMLESLVPK